MRKITTSALIVCSILNGQNPLKETVMRRCDQLKGEIEKLRSQGRKMKKKKECEVFPYTDFYNRLSLPSKKWSEIWEAD